MSTDQVLSEARDLDRPTPGLYASTTQLVEFNVPGLPPAQADRFREQLSGLEGEDQPYCLTKEEAKKGFEDMLKTIGEASNGMACGFAKFEVDAPRLVADLSCSGPVGAKADIGFAGETTSESLELDMDMTAEMAVIPGGSMEMRFKVKSQRIGDCSESQLAEARKRSEAAAAAAE
ncbi:hypothetical protein GCM10022213_10700 [Parerythrobacter jejuensis]